MKMHSAQIIAVSLGFLKAASCAAEVNCQDPIMKAGLQEIAKEVRAGQSKVSSDIRDEISRQEHSMKLSRQSIDSFQAEADEIRLAAEAVANKKNAAKIPHPNPSDFNYFMYHHIQPQLKRPSLAEARLWVQQQVVNEVSLLVWAVDEIKHDEELQYKSLGNRPDRAKAEKRIYLRHLIALLKETSPLDDTDELTDRLQSVCALYPIEAKGQSPGSPPKDDGTGSAQSAR